MELPIATKGQGFLAVWEEQPPGRLASVDRINKLGDLFDPSARYVVG